MLCLILHQRRLTLSDWNLYQAGCPCVWPFVQVVCELEETVRGLCGNTKRFKILPSGVDDPRLTANNNNVTTIIEVWCGRILRSALLLVGFYSTICQPTMP